MYSLSVRSGAALAVVVVVAVLMGGCSSRVRNRAPVEDRGLVSVQPVPEVTESMTPEVTLLPGSENAGKPGFYTVKPGDTLIRIGLDHGQSYRDIARWSSVDNPNRIEVGQVLRVVPPVASGVVTKPVLSASVTPLVGLASAPPSPAAPSVGTSATADDEIGWIWPANGVVLAGFDEIKNKGIDIGGMAGDPVLAAADGRVVYAGAGLRGYGNLIILKHNNTYLTAYAHNQTLLIKEDQAVRKGQKIAEMGASDSDRVKLHFEVRRQGKPVDPAKYLPAR